MNTRLCCHNAPRLAFRARRGVEFAGWIIPSATLVLIPKCPVCVAMYVALFSGVSISVAIASNLRTALLILCIAALIWLALKRLCRLAFPKNQGSGVASKDSRFMALGSRAGNS
jgi:hypothetical protein